MSKRARRKLRGSAVAPPPRHGDVARTDVLPYSEPPRPVARPVEHEQPNAVHPLVGSEVLDSIGTAGKFGRAMHDVIHSPDDEVAVEPRGPEQEASVSFHPDPELGDAGADLADDLGRSYLQSATTGEDMSELENEQSTDPAEVGGPFLEEEAGGEDALDEEPEPGSFIGEGRSEKDRAERVARPVAPSRAGAARAAPRAAAPPNASAGRPSRKQRAAPSQQQPSPARTGRPRSGSGRRR